MKITVKNKAIYYLRVSTEEQANEAYGLESQQSFVEAFCRERGWEVVTHFEDRGISGWHEVERPGFNRMLKYLREHRDVNLVVFDYSRFGRKTLPALEAFDRIDALGVYSVAAKHPEIDCRTPLGRKARRDSLSDAENDSDQKSVDTTARMKAAFEAGRWCRPAPLGYRTLGIDRRGRKGGSNLIPVDAEAKLVIRAFELVALGNDTTADILRSLTVEGLRTKRGNEMRLGEFRKMLSNPVYIGKMQSKKWGTVDGLHEPLIAERLFKNVQLVLKGKRPIAAPYTLNREDFPLRRFLKCSECGGGLTGGFSKGGNNKPYGYYNCFRCRAVKSVRMEKAAEEFLHLLERLTVGPSFVKEFSSILREEWLRRTGDSSAASTRLKRRIKEQRDLQDKLAEGYLRGDSNIVELYPRMNQKFKDDIAAFEAELADLELEKATFDELLSFSEEFLTDIPLAWMAASVDQKQRVQNVLFPSGLKYHPEKGILNDEIDSVYAQLEGFLGGKVGMVRPTRFERVTYSFGGCCSIQLSYGRLGERAARIGAENPALCLQVLA